MTPDMREQIEVFVGGIYERFTEHVELARADKFKSKLEDRKNNIYNSRVFLGQEALEHG